MSGCGFEAGFEAGMALTRPRLAFASAFDLSPQQQRRISVSPGQSLTTGRRDEQLQTERKRSETTPGQRKGSGQR
jgi:hypothetical protein